MPPRRKPTVDDLIALVLGAPAEFTAAEVAGEAGIPLAEASRLWRAMGFPDVGNARAFTRADADAAKALMKLVDSGQLTFDEAVELVRSAGQTTARLSEWQSETLGRAFAERGVVEHPEAIAPEEIPGLMKQTRAFLPVLQKIMVHTYRRQLATSVARSGAAISNGEGETTAGHMSVGFADIVGFTQISRELPDAQLAALVGTFEAACSDIVASTGARIVKTLGDEIMFVGNEAVPAAEAALMMHESAAEQQDTPKLRIGIATGSVISRMGDVFGTTVNRASRLTVMARPQGTFVDWETMSALSGDPRFAVRGARPRRAQGFGLMRSWSLQRGQG